MEELERVLEDLERVFHVHIQWKSVGRGNPSCGLSERHTFHGCEFCRRVKAEKRRYRLCSENDDILLPRPLVWVGGHSFFVKGRNRRLSPGRTSRQHSHDKRQWYVFLHHAFPLCINCNWLINKCDTLHFYIL